MIEHERARIARDLHDQLGANLTQITLLGEMAETDKELPAEIEQHAQQICVTARETTRSLDEIVWAVNPSNDTLESLANYACKYAQDYFAMAGVSFRAELPAGSAAHTDSARSAPQRLSGVQGGRKQCRQARPRHRGAGVVAAGAGTVYLERDGQRPRPRRPFRRRSCATA